MNWILFLLIVSSDSLNESHSIHYLEFKSEVLCEQAKNNILINKKEQPGLYILRRQKITATCLEGANIITPTQKEIKK